MQAMEREPSGQSQAPRAPASFELRSFLFWLPACLVNAIALAWLAVLAERHFAPWLLFPLGCGVLVGLGCVVAMVVCGAGHRPSLWAGTTLAALVFVGGQHHFHYRVRQQLDVARHSKNSALMARAEQAFPQLADRAPPPPSNLLEYLKRRAREGRPLVGGWVAQGSWAWLSWACDALLVMVGSWAALRLAIGRPFCNDCQSWYRTTRAGKLSTEQLRALAQTARVTLPDPSGPGHYRLLTCRSGCGNWLLELAWHGERGVPVAARPGRVSAWIEAARRPVLTEQLDQCHRRPGLEQTS